MDQPLETYQDEIYLAGLGGVTPDLPTDLNELERAADGRLTPGAYAYITGSAGSGDTAGPPPCASRRVPLAVCLPPGTGRPRATRFRSAEV